MPAKPRSTPPKRTTAKATHTAAVTNGTRLLHADARGLWARRFRDIVHRHCDDLGGINHLTEAKLCIVKRAATIAVELEGMESNIANGERDGFDLLKFCQASNALRRMLETIGLERIEMKDITAPSLRDLVARHQNDAAFVEATAQRERDDVIIEEGYDARIEDPDVPAEDPVPLGDESKDERRAPLADDDSAAITERAS